MKIPFLLKDVCTGLLDLVYPRTCAACAREAPIDNDIFCVNCLAALSYSESHLHKENEFTHHFWGRVPISFGAAMLYLIPSGLTQNLIHEIKYRGRKEFAESIGAWYGKKLLMSPFFRLPDLIIPVPLHPKKEHQRGYNQSAFFGNGLSTSLNVPLDKRSLIRNRFTTSQTKKSRIDRLDNMDNAFSIEYPDRIKGRHVLLIDDVLTTGATLEACGVKLLEASAAKLSMVTIAMGRI